VPLFSGPTSAAPLAHVVPGSVWTIADLPPLTGIPPCDIIHFAAGRIWTDDSGASSGTWGGGGAGIRMHWKKGPEAAYKLAFVGSWTTNFGGVYAGTFTDTKGTSSGYLLPGVQC
jgi:hypothetical protein